MNVDQADPRYIGTIELLRHTGARNVTIRYSEPDKPDEPDGKTCWLAIADFGPKGWDCAGAVAPLGALIRLCEQLIDGGKCMRCQRPTSFLGERPALSTQVMDTMTCAFVWEESSSMFVRTCERAANN